MAPAAGQAIAAGTSTTLRFAADGDFEEMEVLLSLDGGRSFSLRVTREMSGGTHQLEWRVPNLPTTRARLALRVGNDEEGEVIRDVSEEFTILGSPAEPLEKIRPFRGEWRAGEALDEMPFAPPFEPSGVMGTGDSIRALPRDTDLDRTSAASPAPTPERGHREIVQRSDPDRRPPPGSPPLGRSLPKRE